MDKICLKRWMHFMFFSFSRAVSVSVMTAMTGVRHINVPSSGRLKGCVLACNHQSYLDPVLVGMAFGRPLHYLARSELFDIPVFSALIRSLGAHPVQQGSADRGALKTVIGLLRSGEPVLLFPEGTRTHDGGIGIFQPGIASIAGRCDASVIPVCIEGAFRSWPRSRLFPAPARVGVFFGDPIAPSGRGRVEFTRLLHSRISDMQRHLRLLMGR